MWQTKSCATAKQRRKGFEGLVLRIEEGKVVIDKDADHGTQGSFHSCAWWAGRALTPAARPGQKLAAYKRRHGGETGLPVCTNVLTGTLPEDLLIWYPDWALNRRASVPHFARTTDLRPASHWLSRHEDVCLHPCYWRSNQRHLKRFNCTFFLKTQQGINTREWRPIQPLTFVCSEEGFPTWWRSQVWVVRCLSAHTSSSQWRGGTGLVCKVPPGHNRVQKRHHSWVVSPLPGQIVAPGRTMRLEGVGQRLFQSQQGRR